MPELALQLIEKEKQEKTGKLDLGNCGLKDIPEELFELTWLEELFFRNKIWDNNKKTLINSSNSGKKIIYTLQNCQPGLETWPSLKNYVLEGNIEKGGD